MLHYDRTDVFEGTDINTTSASKECIICHYCYFQIKCLNFDHLSIMASMMY